MQPVKNAFNDVAVEHFEEKDKLVIPEMSSRLSASLSQMRAEKFNPSESFNRLTSQTPFSQYKSSLRISSQVYSAHIRTVPVPVPPSV
jgi:hypothetical protein